MTERTEQAIADGELIRSLVGSTIHGLQLERQRVFSVRRDEVPFNDVLTEIGELGRELEDLLEISPLRPDPDRRVVDGFVRAYRQHWDGR